MGSGSILIVRKEDLSKTPEGFQKYVTDHFKESVLVGVPVFMASIRINWDAEDYEAWKRGQTRGIAPLANRVSRRDYLEGFPDGQDLYDWIRDNPQLVEKLIAVGEREVYGWDDD